MNALPRSNLTIRLPARRTLAVGRRGLLNLVLSACALCAQPAKAAPPPPKPSDLQWRDARDLTIEGKGWTDTKDFYDRLPARAEPTVRKAVWTLSHNSAGMAVRFTTDATSISARWILRKEPLAMAHMPASGVSGLDLYVRQNGKWHWLGSGRPDKSPANEKQLVGGLTPAQREYLLYLPLYNGVSELKIGVPTDASIAPAPRRETKPIAFYGTSILQGGCASRPGMAYPAILCRRLDVPHINLGFSGNAWGEPEVARFLAELDPSVFVLDPLPNMTAESVKQRIEPFVRIIREQHPKTPIILIEHIPYQDGDFVAKRRERYVTANVELKQAYARLRKAGVKYLFYVPAKNLAGSDGDATVDGTHPTDLGFERMADGIEPFLRRAFKARN